MNELKLAVEAYASLDEAHSDGAFLWADTWPHDTPPACVWRDTGTGTTGLPGHLETTKANADRFAALWNAMAGIPDPQAYVAAFEAMVEALEKVIPEVDWMPYPNCVQLDDAVRAALQSARIARGDA